MEVVIFGFSCACTGTIGTTGIGTTGTGTIGTGTGTVAHICFVGWMYEFYFQCSTGDCEEVAVHDAVLWK
jgi:hypothetical protein